MDCQEHLAAYRNTCVAVLGATGFIGRWVARVLSDCGAALLLPVRDPAGAQAIFHQYGIAGEISQLDLGQPGATFSFFRSAAPAITFNLAGYGVARSERDSQRMWRMNASLPADLCEAIAGTPPGAWRGQRLVHAGSALEYGTITGNLAEDSHPNPTTEYGISKLAGSRGVAEQSRKLGIAAITARLFTVYGPGEHTGRLLPALIETAISGRPLPLTYGLQRRDFTYVEDVVEGLLRLGSRPQLEPGVLVNVATGGLTPVRSFAEEACRVLGIRSELLHFGELPAREEEMSHDDVSVERLVGLTGWRPKTSIAEGVWKTAKFQQVRGLENGYGDVRHDAAE